MKVLVIHGHRDPGDHIISDECMRRLRAAEDLRAEAVIFTGRGADAFVSEARQMLERVIADWPEPFDYGFPPPPFDRTVLWHGRTCLLEEDSETTAENARQAMRLCLTLRATHVVVVTSWWHVPRCWVEWQRVAMPDVNVSFHGCRGAWRYAPAEVRALWRATNPERIKEAV